MKKVLFATAVVAIATLVMAAPTWAQEQQWVKVAQSSKFSYEAMTGSVSSDEKGAHGISRAVGEKYVHFYRFGVRSDQCLVGVGKLVSTKLDLQEPQFSDYVLGGGTVASGIAEYLCSYANVQGGTSL